MGKAMRLGKPQRVWGEGSHQLWEAAKRRRWPLGPALSPKFSNIPIAEVLFSEPEDTLETALLPMLPHF